MLRKVIRRKQTEGNALLNLPCYPSRRKHSGRKGIHQELHHHSRLVRRAPTAVASVRRMKRAQVQSVDKFADVIRQMPFRKLSAKIRWKQQHLARRIRTEPPAHWKLLEISTTWRQAPTTNSMAGSAMKRRRISYDAGQAASKPSRTLTALVPISCRAYPPSMTNRVGSRIAPIDSPTRRKSSLSRQKNEIGSAL